MIQLSKETPVLVTGANGYVASWLVKTLLEQGITVHAAVRDPNNDKKISHLIKAANGVRGTLKLFKTDLLTKGAYAKAMQGCELVFHTASPFTLKVKNPKEDLIDPALEGTTNLLDTVNHIKSVKRVVLTSSIVAMYADNTECDDKPNGVISDKSWNESASLTYLPYNYSKVLAEKKAWKMMSAQSRWDLVTINPGLVVGPPLNPHQTTSETMAFIKMLAGGDLKYGVPKVGIGIVDVRDVASAHFKAGYTMSAKGRYITVGKDSDFLEMATVLLPTYGKQFPLPKKAIPKWLFWLIGPLIDPLYSRNYISKNVNIPWKSDRSKVKEELKMTFKPLRETMEDTFKVLIEEGILIPKK